MDLLEISTEEPFTSEEARTVLQLGLRDYQQALGDGRLQASGVIRLVVPCRAPHHTFWDLFRYCILSEVGARLRSSPVMHDCLEEVLDDLAMASAEEGLNRDQIKICLTQFQPSSLENAQGTTYLYWDVLSRAVLAGFDRINIALQRVFAPLNPVPVDSVISVIAS
jgi:hypothetical protein